MPHEPQGSERQERTAGRLPLDLRQPAPGRQPQPLEPVPLALDPEPLVHDSVWHLLDPELTALGPVWQPLGLQPRRQDPEQGVLDPVQQPLDPGCRLHAVERYRQEGRCAM